MIKKKKPFFIAYPSRETYETEKNGYTVKSKAGANPPGVKIRGVREI